MAFVPDDEPAPTGSRFVPDERRASDKKDEGAKPLPANAGLASFGASLLGLPMDTIKNALNLGIAGYGAGKTALTGQPGPGLIETLPGDSGNVRGMLRSTGAPGLSPDNPTPNSKMGTAQYEFVSRGGVLPGGALPAAGSMVAESIGGPEWAGVGSLTPTAAITAYNAARAPGLAFQEARNARRDETLRRAQDAGFGAPSSQVNATWLGNRLEGLGGKAAINQEFGLRNQQATNTVVRQELRVPENTPITERLLETLRTQAAQPYRDVAALSPLAQNTLQQLRDARAEANVQHRAYDRNATPDALREARRQDARAQMLERVLEREATRRGRPELVPQLHEARTYIAKTWDVERALNVADGNVEARLLGKAVDRGRPLTGGLATAGNFAEAFPMIARPGASTPPPGVSALEHFSMMGLGGGGYALGGAPGAALGAAVPLLARPAARATALSDLYQQHVVRPDYTPNVRPQGTLEALVQQSIIQNQANR